jgi:SSS family solute:Na+ symporter
MAKGMVFIDYLDLGLIISWFAALLGPVAFPMMLGLLPVFNRADHRAALLSIGAGFLTFVFTKFILEVSLAIETGAPVIIAFAVYCLVGLLAPRKFMKKGTP